MIREGVLRLDGQVAIIGPDGRWRSDDSALLQALQQYYPPRPVTSGAPWTQAFWDAQEASRAEVLQPPDGDYGPGIDGSWPKQGSAAMSLADNAPIVHHGSEPPGPGWTLANPGTWVKLPDTAYQLELLSRQKKEDRVDSELRVPESWKSLGSAGGG